MCVHIVSYMYVLTVKESAVISGVWIYTSSGRYRYRGTCVHVVSYFTVQEECCVKICMYTKFTGSHHPGEKGALPRKDPGGRNRLPHLNHHGVCELISYLVIEIEMCMYACIVD